MHTGGMPVRLHHIVVDAHDLPGLARFWTQALGWKVLSEREAEIVIGTDENALWVPRSSSTSRDPAVFVDQATDAGLSSDPVLSEIDRFG